MQSRIEAADGHKAIQIEKTYGDLPKITCNPSQLNQVFLEIIKNGIDSLREDTTQPAQPTIYIRTELIEEGALRIEIANNGQPIPTEIQDRIFDPFFTTKAVGDGAGLGLFVSYSTIQRHGGALTVASRPEADTEFEIVLPQLAAET